MKKKRILWLALLTALIFPMSVLAIPYDQLVSGQDPSVAYTWPNPTQTLYADENPTDGLPSSSFEGEEAWLNALLGNPDPAVESIILTGPDTEDGKASGGWVYGDGDVQYDLGMGWDFAIVKYGTYWAAYENSNSDFLLDIAWPPLGPTGYSAGVSHIHFFGPTSVPEPATMLLLGTGLIGMAIIGRKKIKI